MRQALPRRPSQVATVVNIRPEGKPKALACACSSFMPVAFACVQGRRAENNRDQCDVIGIKAVLLIRRTFNKHIIIAVFKTSHPIKR